MAQRLFHPVPQTITSNSNHAGVNQLCGFSIKETSTTTAARVNLRVGAVGGQILFAINLAADQTAWELFPTWVDAGTGVYVEVVAGAISGVLYNAL